MAAASSNAAAPPMICVHRSARTAPTARPARWMNTLAKAHETLVASAKRMPSTEVAVSSLGSMPSDRPAVIVNPRSGGGLSPQLWARLSRALAEGLGPFLARFTEAPGDGRRLARQ